MASSLASVNRDEISVILPPRNPSQSCCSRTMASLWNAGSTSTLQVNVGFTCNLSCRHCHLDAGPMRRELMTAETIGHVTAYAEKVSFENIDLTGGAPEINSNISSMILRLAPLTARLSIRTNLIALQDDSQRLLF